MVDLGQLAIAERLLVCRERRGGVVAHFEVEERGYEALGRAEGGDDDARVEGLPRGGVLDGEVLLRLSESAMSA